MAEATQQAKDLLALGLDVGSVSVNTVVMRPGGEVLEEHYTRARQQGVLFTRYDLEHKPGVSQENGELVVTAFDPTIQRKVQLKPDLLVLSAAIVPRNNDHVANLFKVSRTLDNFYLEAHMKLRPVDFAADGIFMAGIPKTVLPSPPR